MLRRKTASPYFVYSLLIHSVLLLVVWWLVPKPISEDSFYDGITTWITRVKPLSTVKPPVFVKPAVSPEPTTPKIVEAEKPPTPPKPQAGLSETWQLTAQDSADLPGSETRKQERFKARRAGREWTLTLKRYSGETHGLYCQKSSHTEFG